MKRIKPVTPTLTAMAFALALSLVIPYEAGAHCDTLDGPVVQDARKAIEAKNVTPALKWVKPGAERSIRTAFNRVLTAKGGEKARLAAENQFFATLVKVHRAGEGASFAGLKPAGAVEPAVAEADKALVAGSSDALVKLITDDAAAGIRARYEKAAETYKHKDEGVAQGRAFVEAYVEFTHYVERLHGDVAGKGEAAGHDGGGNRHSPAHKH